MYKRILIPILMLMVSLQFSMAEDGADQFLGKWALHFEGGMGWLEVRQESGFLDADLLWVGGSVTPVANVYVTNGKLVATRAYKTSFDKADGSKREHTITHLLELKGQGDKLIGTMTIPSKNGDGANVYYIHADRVPPLAAAPDLSKIKYGNPINLLENGLSDWRLLEPSGKSGWGFDKGVLVNNPAQEEGKPHIRYGNLRTNAEFEAFNLKLKVNIPEGSNSGVYLKGIYEIQVMDSYKKELDNHHMGALYSRITPSESAEKKAGKWQDMDITLCDRHVTVILNGKKIIDNQPVEGVTGGAMTSDEFKPGPIYLQGDHGSVSYKDIVLTPILK